MAFSALVDLVGVRELATENPVRYEALVTVFREQLKRLVKEHKYCRVRFYPESSFVVCDTARHLVTVLGKLRYQLVHQEALFSRAVATPGEVGDEYFDEFGGRLRGYKHNRSASRLFRLVESMKGVGTWLRPDEDSPDDSPDWGTTFQNYFVSDHRGRHARFVQFDDVPLEAKHLTQHHLNQLLLRFREGRAGSGKLGRFYVPVFVNWARHMNVEVPEPGLDGLVSGQQVKRYRDVVGMELVFLTLADRVFGKDGNKFEQNRAKALKKTLLQQQWLRTLISGTSEESHLIPQSILQPFARRSLITAIVEKEAGKADDEEAAVETEA